MRDFSNYSELVSIPDYKFYITGLLYACNCLDEYDARKYKRERKERDEKKMLEIEYLNNEKQMRSFYANRSCLSPKRGLSDHYGYGGQW